MNESNWIHSDQSKVQRLTGRTLMSPATVRPRLSGPLLSGSLAIRKKIVGYRFTAYGMHTYSVRVRLSGSLAYLDIFRGKRMCAV